jgi:hypothetical protein
MFELDAIQTACREDDGILRDLKTTRHNYAIDLLARALCIRPTVIRRATRIYRNARARGAYPSHEDMERIVDDLTTMERDDEYDEHDASLDD